MYYQVFWERYKELTDYERIINVITKGEERIEKKVRMKKALAQKVSNYQKPEIQLKISPSFSKFSKPASKCDRNFRQYAEEQEVY